MQSTPNSWECGSRWVSRLRVLAAALLVAGITANAAADPEPPTPTAAVEAPTPDSKAEEKDLTATQIEALDALAQAGAFLTAGENASTDAERKQNYELSAKQAQRAIELAPDDADAHFILFGAKGRIAQMGGLASAALSLSALNSELDEVLRLDPDHADALAARGGMLMKLPRLMGGNTTEGVRYLERATELNPDGAGTRLELAEAYEIVGRENEALRAGREAIALADQKGEVEKAERARTFVAKLEESCDECKIAAKSN